MKTKLLYVLLFTTILTFSQNWEQVGNTQFTPAVAFNGSIDFNPTTGRPIIVYTGVFNISGNNNVQVMEYDGSSWTNIGGLVSSDDALSPSVSVNPVTNEVWVAYINSVNTSLNIYKYENSNWVPVILNLGGAFVDEGTDIKFNASGTPKISVRTANEVRFYTNTNTVWSFTFLQGNGSDFVTFDKAYSANASSGTRFNVSTNTGEYSVSNVFNTNTVRDIRELSGIEDENFVGFLDVSNVIRVFRKTGTFSQINILTELSLGTSKTIKLRKSSTDNQLYFIYINNTNQLELKRISLSDNAVVDMASPNIATNASDYFDDIEMNPFDGNYYVLYKDGAHISVKKYNIPPLGTKIYVNQNATGNNDGTSWADAFTDLTDAIAVNDPLKDIWVAQGVYLPTSGSGRNRTFNLGNDRRLYGGFLGTETDLSQRDFRTNITVLSGDFNADDNNNILDTENTRHENAFHILTLKGNVKNIIVDGFTISGGNADGIISNNCGLAANAQYDNRRGGALYTQPYSSGNIEAEIVNCVFEKNTANDTAVFSSFYPCGQTNISSTINFESCIVKDNYSATNSAFLLHGSDGFTQRFNSILNNCLFYNNVSVNGASVFYVTTGGSNNPGSDGINVQVINSTFSNNTGLNGNLIRINNNSGTNLKYYMFNSIIWGNGSTTPFLISGNTTQVVNTIVEGGQQTGLNSNPLFVNISQNDYSLQTSSPAIDTGDNGRISSGITEDLLGNQRIFNTTVDMGAYEYGSTTLGNQDFEANLNEVKIFPNPTSSVLNIEIPQTLKQATIYSILGNKVLQTQSKVINTINLKSGMYLIKIEDANGAVATKRFVKQ